MGKLTKSLLDAVKGKYNLHEIQDNKYDKYEELLHINLNINKTASDYDLINERRGRNIFNQQITTLQSKICSQFDIDDVVYMDFWLTKYAKAEDENEEIQLLYDKLMMLNNIIHQTSGNKIYEAYEDDRGGVLSEYMRNELESGRGFTLLITGKPGVGKSFASIRLGINTSGERFKIKVIETDSEGRIMKKDSDLMYTDKEYYLRREERRKDKTLDKSTQIIDEGLEATSSLKGHWDESIKDIIKTIRTQRFENTVLIVVSPEESDIVKKLRDSFHATLEPWFDSTGSNKLDLKTVENINERTGYSSWKFYLREKNLDKGKRLSVGLGRVSKINLLKPPEDVMTDYKRISEEYKRGVQATSLSKAEERDFKSNNKNWVTEKVDELMLIPGWMNKVQSPEGRITITAVSEHFGVKNYIGQKLRNEILKRVNNGEVRKDTDS